MRNHFFGNWLIKGGIQGALKRANDVFIPLRHSTIDEKLFLQGADDGVEGVRDGLAWSLAIDQTTGKMVLTASGDAVGFVIFGACTTL